MKTVIRIMLLSLVLGLAPAAFAPSTASADDYWDGYWSWYDGSYRPYYSRYYSSRPYSSRYYYDDFGPAYYPGNYSRYRGTYYGTPDVGYLDAPGGGQVRVGPLRFGWR